MHINVIILFTVCTERLICMILKKINLGYTAIRSMMKSSKVLKPMVFPTYESKDKCMWYVAVQILHIITTKMKSYTILYIFLQDNRY